MKAPEKAPEKAQAKTQPQDPTQAPNEAAPTGIGQGQKSSRPTMEYDEPTITVKTTEGDFKTKFIVWAGGEFQYPKAIPHTIRPGKNYKDMPVGKHIIIGGSESGMDAAYQLVQYGSEVTVLDENSTWSKRVSDSSYGLSPHTCGRVRELLASGKVGKADTTTVTTIACYCSQLFEPNWSIALHCVACVGSEKGCGASGGCPLT